MVSGLEIFYGGRFLEIENHGSIIYNKPWFPKNDTGSWNCSFLMIRSHPHKTYPARYLISPVIQRHIDAKSPVILLAQQCEHCCLTAEIGTLSPLSKHQLIKNMLLKNVTFFDNLQDHYPIEVPSNINNQTPHKLIQKIYVNIKWVLTS